jgi:O-antigen/teichoic acid export membrane protein
MQAHRSGSRAFLIMAANAGANLARQGTAFVVVLLLPPLLVRTMDKGSYAMWVLILQLGGYIALVDSGIQGVVARFVAVEDSRSGVKGVSEVLSNATVLLLLAGAAGAALTIGASWKLPLFVHGLAPLLMQEVRRAFVIVALCYAAALPFSSLAGIFVGYQKSGINAIAGSVGKFLGAAGTAWAAFRHAGLVWMAVWTGAGTLVQPLIYVFAWRRLPGRPTFGARLVQRASLVNFLTFSSTMMLTQLTALLITGLDLPIVTAFDFPNAAYYAVAATVSNLLLVPFGAIVGAFMPVAAGMHAAGDAERLGLLTLRATRYATVILCLLTLFLALSLPALLTWWIRADYALHATRFAEILIAAQFIRLTCMPYSIAGFGAGQQKQMLVSPIGEGIVNLICSLVGVRLLGAQGVAWGTFIGAIVGVLLHLGVSMRWTDAVRLNPRVFLLSGILRPTVCTAPWIAIYLLLARFATGQLQTLALALTCTAAAIPFVFRFGLGSSDRTGLAGQMQALSSRFRRSARQVPQN